MFERSLFARPYINDTHTGDEFYKRILEENENYERTINDNVHLNVENDNINLPFTIDQLTAVQSKLKNKKAIGIDAIPNDVLKLSSPYSLTTGYYYSTPKWFCKRSVFATKLQRYQSIVMYVQIVF